MAHGVWGDMMYLLGILAILRIYSSQQADFQQKTMQAHKTVTRTQTKPPPEPPFLAEAARGSLQKEVLHWKPDCKR